jgi:propanediol utilization protein pduH
MTISLRERLMNEEKNPVAINIYYNKNLAIDKRIKTILCGIEEEEIPFILIPDDGDDVKVLGDKAAKSSKLGVGIGISSNRVTLYQEKLSIEKPLFECSLNSSDYTLRAIGTNGARLIKGNPFIII